MLLKNNVEAWRLESFEYLDHNCWASLFKQTLPKITKFAHELTLTAAEVCTRTSTEGLTKNGLVAGMTCSAFRGINNLKQTLWKEATIVTTTILRISDCHYSNYFLVPLYKI